MRCVCREHEIPFYESNNCLDRVTLETDDQSVCWSSCPTDAQQQSAPLISTDTRRRLWIHDKLRQNRLRQAATRHGLPRRMSPHRNAGTPGAAGCELATATDNARRYGRDLLMRPANATTVEEAAKSFLDDAAVAEVMTYLNRTYGPGFVRKMIKHLPNPRSRRDPGPQPGTAPSATKPQQRG